MKEGKLMHTQAKKYSGSIDNKPMVKEARGRMAKIDPKMAEYMGRLFVDKKNFYYDKDEAFEAAYFNKYKFKEYVYSKPKREITEEDELKMAAEGLVKLSKDLKLKSNK
ncbi:hypothetical protein GVAV_001511 [Gurleya vavrai]